MNEFVSIGSMARRTLLTAVVLAVGFSAFCTQADGQRRGMRQRGNNLEMELQQLTQVLTLTQSQQSQVWTLLKERRQKMQALRSSAKSDAADQAPGTNIQQAVAIFQDSNAKIRALLNDDQKVKFDAWQEQRMERWTGMGGERAPAAAPAPAPAPAPQPPSF
jgi:Spy/CpxP family protein refolding chaperone